MSAMLHTPQAGAPSHVVLPPLGGSILTPLTFGDSVDEPTKDTDEAISVLRPPMTSILVMIPLSLFMNLSLITLGIMI